MWSLAETGLHSKWFTSARSSIAQTVLELIGTSNIEDESLEVGKNHEQWFESWKVIIVASGPFMYGLLMAILLLVLEFWFKYIGLCQKFWSICVIHFQSY